MGSCLGTQTPITAAVEISAKIDNQNVVDIRREQEKVKLLLLGPGESGKSTICKQLKVLHGMLSEDDKRLLTPVICQNIISSMRTLLQICEERNLHHSLNDQDSYELLKSTDEYAPIDSSIGRAIKSLWAEPKLRELWEKHSEFQIMESASHFFNHIDRIMKPGYSATVQDVLYTRVRTTGIITDNYEIDNTTFEIYDVGGQRNERKKWIHCFDGVTAVLFVASISEYDQMLFEDVNMNRISEALSLFQQTCSNRFFQSSSIILLLNKRDLFEKKIKKVDIASIDLFSDFKGPPRDAEAGSRYFKDKFLANRGSFKNDIYVHVVCATDTDNVSKMFTACKKIVLKDSLRISGFA